MPNPLPAGRLRPFVDPVTVTLDGESVVAERGEPLCAAFVAAGKLPFARSPKFHRPRGPACLRAACDGCLARVDETPNVMTCLVPAEEGSTVVTQNRLGPRDADLLRMTDWFFREGMNHHELFAGVVGLQNVMQVFARRVAGLGRMPTEVTAPRPATRRRIGAVVVGGGPYGMAVATRLARSGRAVEVIDDQLALGGGALALGDDADFASILDGFAAEVARGAIRARPSTVAGGVYGRDLLVVGPEGAEILEPEALVLACGAHDGALAFEGNDIPGIMSARAAGWLLSRGVRVGDDVVVLVTPGGGPFGESYARRLPGARLVHGEPVAVVGSRRVKKVTVRTDGKLEEMRADALVIDAPRSPAYELGEQAGAALRHEPRGFVVQNERGRAAEGVYVTGEMAGLPLDAAAAAAHADEVAATILAAG